MAKPREIDPTGYYHVMSRGNFGQAIFPTNTHYRRHLQLLARVAARRQWIVLDWCQMRNHFHLVLKLTADGLSAGMQELNGCFSRWSNQRAGRTGTGHLVKNRFLAIDLMEEGHFWEVLRYVPNNPVSAGLVAQPENWPWSGYRATVGLVPPEPFHQPAELVRIFGVQPAVGLGRYVSFVQEGRVRAGLEPWSDHEREAWHRG